MRKPTQQQLGRRLAELRKRAKLTQGDVAERLGIADETLSRIERGAQWTDFKTLIELCELYGSTWADLVPTSPERNSARARALQALMSAVDGWQLQDLELLLGLAREVAAHRKRNAARP